MKSVEDNSKSVILNKNDNNDNENDDDEKEIQQQNIPEKIPKIAEETRRMLPNPTLLHSRKSKDIDEWLDEMKFYAWKSRGIPESRRKELWLTLAEKYFRSKCINWQERRNTSMYIEDRDMEDQIIKDLHRTGSAFCSGPNSIINQGKLKHLLLEYAQWNPKVGYCQGFNVLGAFILQVMEKEQENSLKIMVYLLEGILPPGYYSESLVGLQIDMAVFRQLMFEQLPKLATHVQNLETGQGFDEPPLTNLFTMQWFLTIFCTCLAMPSLLRIWDLIFLEGNEVIFRTSLAIWSIMERYVTKMNSIDDFYGNTGILFQRLCSGSMCDPADLIRIVSRFKPISNLHVLRVKHKQLSERNKKPNRSNQKTAIRPSSSSVKKNVDDLNKKVNIKNIDMSVFKKQYEKLKRRPSLELASVTLSKKPSDGKNSSSNFSVNKFWSNNNISSNNNIKKKLLNPNENNKKEHLININKHHKKIDNNLVSHHRHMKSKKSPDIKQFPKPEQLDSKKIIKKDEIQIPSSDSSSTTSLCDNDDNDDDSLYECSSLNYYYTDSIDETCDNWPNIEVKNSDKDTIENVNLILEQIASYSTTTTITSTTTTNTSTKNDDNNDDNDDDDDNNIKENNDNQSEKLLKLEVTTLPDTENLICDENDYNIKNYDSINDDNTINDKFDYKEIEKWREKYLKTSNDTNLDNPSIKDDDSSSNINENILNNTEISKISNINNVTPSLSIDYTNFIENQNLFDKPTNDQSNMKFETQISDSEIILKKSISSEKISSSFDIIKTIEPDDHNELSNKEINLDSENKNISKELEQSQQQPSVDNSNIVENGVTNELFDNLFQNKFSQFAKYAVKDYLEGIHYTKSSLEEDGETKTETKTYYDVFKIIEENSKVLDSLSKKSNNIIISPANSSDNIQQDSEKSDDKFKNSSPIRDDDLNGSLSDIKNIKGSQKDLATTTTYDEISSSTECNSSSIKTDVTEIYEKSNVEFKIDTVEDEFEQINVLEMSTKKFNIEENQNKPDELQIDETYFQPDRMSKSFEDKIEHEKDIEFLALTYNRKNSSKSLENLENIQTNANIILSRKFEEKEKEDEEKLIRRIEQKSPDFIESKYVSKRNSYYDEIQNENISENKHKTTFDDDDDKISIYENSNPKSYNYERIIYPSSEISNLKEKHEEFKTTKSIYDDEKNFENKKIIVFPERDTDEKYDQYWYIEKPDQIEKRRDSLQKSSASPSEVILYDSSNLKNSKEINSSSSSTSYKYNNESDDDFISKIRSKNLDELEFKEQNNSLVCSSSSTEKILYPSKSVRIFESSIDNNTSKKLSNKYDDEYNKESNYKDYDDEYSSKTFNKNREFIDKKNSIKYNDYSVKNDNDYKNDDNTKDDVIQSKTSYESLTTYDRKYFSRKDESDFKERLESIKNTIKFIDDLCDENDKINRKKRCQRDPNARKSLIYEDLLSKTQIPVSSNENDNRYNKTITFYSSEQCSNKNSSNKYNYSDDNDDDDDDDDNSSIIDKKYESPSTKYNKKNSSYENLNVQNENHELNNLYNSSSTYKSKIINDTKVMNTDFESLERRKSKSYSNIYFTKVE